MNSISTDSVLRVLRNWWNFNGIKENSILLSGILIG